MPRRIFYLDTEKTEFVDVSWDFNWRNMSVVFNDHEIGSFNNQKELQLGKAFSLDASRILEVKLVGMMNPGLVLSLNGHDIEESQVDLEKKLNSAVTLGLYYGGFSLLIGIISFFVDLGKYAWLGLNITSSNTGINSMVLGVIAMALAFQIKKKSLFAMYSYMGLIVISMCSLFYISAHEVSEINPDPSTGLLSRLLILYSLTICIPVVKKLKRF